MKGTQYSKTLSAVVATLAVLAAPVQVALAFQETASTSTPAPESAQQIQALVAPIALYPDQLVAQVLSAATYPDQISDAETWVTQHASLTGESLMDAVNQQSWDPAVKAITAFPSVLSQMANNLAWTSQLGEVYHFQASDVMQAVQALRAQAQTAGNLKSGAQITVVQQAPSTIVIEPVNPAVVYVPAYNPAVIYGTPYVVPGYTAADVAAASVISFGAGIAIGAMMSGACCHAWGWNTWSMSWHGGYVGWGGHPYYGNAAWHGGYGAYGYHGYGGYGGAAYHGPAGSTEAAHGYGPAGGYHTGSSYQNAWGGASTHTGYAPDGTVHTGGSGYNAAGQAYHYGATSTPYGGSSYHGTTNTGQHVAGGTTASGQHWASSDGWSSRAASSRGWSSGGGGVHR
jgi:Protein of unknown function (DUF3300)